MTDTVVTLDDKYTARSGRVFLNGTQALIRMLLLQRDRDRRAGLRTAGFVTGYRGSPLGTIDMELTRARRMLEGSDIRFVPGVNEDLAATSLWGTQQIHLRDRPEWDGVFGLWYGKGPGVDRTGDAFRHANLAGSAANGGVLALAGDDHTCKSSTTSHQSEYALVDAMMPILVPSTVAEMVEYGLHGWALSRFSGCWAAMKVTAEHTDCSVSLDLAAVEPSILLPDGLELPPGGRSIRWPDTPQEQEERLHRIKIPAAMAYVRANRLDRVILGDGRADFGIVTAGKTALDVLEALGDLGIDARTAAAAGVAVFKVGVSWPLEPEAIRAFAAGKAEILVAEDKRPLIEGQIRDLLYGLPEGRRPRIVGKRDDRDEPLLPSHGELGPGVLALAIASRLRALGRLSLPDEAVARLSRGASAAGGLPAAIPKRTPYFCSGCPHNSSTKVPDGSRAMAGIGCHWMSQAMDRETATYTHMGGEGANWIGLAPFVPTPHVFQNMGDGTFFHSGLLAIRAAIAAKINITYKILFNDAVAMTGGQRHDGVLTPQAIAWQVRAEGVQRIALVSEDPSRYGLFEGLPPYVSLHHRDDLDAVQRELREVPGVSALIFDQTCAAEKRRRRKRGRMETPDRRVVINERVCEGCGDCSTQSNCLSVVPVETEFGRKRQIDQTSCNQDFSCLKGFCPSFVTIEGATPRKSRKAAAPDISGLPQPERPALDRPYGILITGIGGTGVITIGALIGMAAHLEGKDFSILDQTGMAQKGGAVMSHIRIAAERGRIAGARLPAGSADALIGCDLLVAAGADAMACLGAERSRAVLNRHEAVAGSFIRNRDERQPRNLMVGRIMAVCGGANVSDIDATDLAVRLLGDGIATNALMMGYAWQKGLIPVAAESIERAIELNGVAVAMNRAAFAWGRLAAVDSAAVFAAAEGQRAGVRPAHRVLSNDLESVIARRVEHLTGYQDAGYADHYRRLVDRVRAAEAALGTGKLSLTETVARNLHKVMAYKDEYEVARLYTDGAFADQLKTAYEDGYRLRFHLAPPLLAPRDPATGHLKKSAYGPWVMTAFRLLARGKRLRGTWLDPFGHTAERKAERTLVRLYEAAVERMLANLSADRLLQAMEIAAIPDGVRGFGHVKDAALAGAIARLSGSPEGGRAAPAPAMAAE